MGLRSGNTPGKKSFYFGAALFTLLALSVGHQKERADFVTGNWVRSEGVITDSELIERTGGPRRYAAFGIRVWYEYPTPGGILPGGPAEADMDTLHTRSSAEKALRGRFAPGDFIEIFYDPLDPSSSSLGSSQAAGRGWQIFLIFIALAFIYLAQNPMGAPPTRRM